jgi:hypothetical protein
MKNVRTIVKKELTCYCLAMYLLSSTDNFAMVLPVQGWPFFLAPLPVLRDFHTLLKSWGLHTCIGMIAGPSSDWGSLYFLSRSKKEKNLQIL